MGSLKTSIATRPFDAANYVSSVEDAADYLNIAFETGNADEVADAFGVICRALTKSEEGGLKALAQSVGLSRSVLYQSLKTGGNPRLGTLLLLMNQLGISLRALPCGNLEATETVKVLSA
jgi:probable addiction module antidote protein